MKLAVLTVLLVALATVAAVPRVQRQRGLTVAESLAGAGHPYLFLSVPRGRSGPLVKGYEIIQNDDVDDDDDADQFEDDIGNDDDAADDAGDDIADNDDDDDIGNDDDDDYVDDGSDGIDGIIQQGSFRAVLGDENLAEITHADQMMGVNDDVNKIMQALANNNNNNREVTPAISNLQSILQNAKPTHMMVSKEHAGAIMVPDGIIEIEGQTVYDEKTGKSALLVPRAALDAIPDGSVVALMERSPSVDEKEEERANRVIVRRRRRGSRRGVRRRVNGNRVNGNRIRRRRVGGGNRRGGNRRRRVNRRNVRVVRRGGGGGNNRRRRVNNRRRVGRPVVYRG